MEIPPVPGTGGISLWGESDVMYVSDVMDVSLKPGSQFGHHHWDIRII